MITIHTILIGKPQTLTDEQGTWQSSIYRQPVQGAIALGLRGLEGDQVTDTRHHGSPDQAVCCHTLGHYDYWNDVYGLAKTDKALGPGAVGENWTLTEADEAEICVGDIYAVGEARVQVSGPRYPCAKQERKLQLPGYLKQILETLRTGFYLRTLTPGLVQAGDSWTLEARPQPGLTLRAVNACVHHQLDPELAQRLLNTPELAKGWQDIVRHKLAA